MWQSSYISIQQRLLSISILISTALILDTHKHGTKEKLSVNIEKSSSLYCYKHQPLYYNRLTNLTWFLPPKINHLIIFATVCMSWCVSVKSCWIMLKCWISGWMMEVFSSTDTVATTFSANSNLSKTKIIIFRFRTFFRQMIKCKLN